MPGIGEAGVILLILLALAGVLGVFGGMILWGRWVARRQGGAWRYTVWMPAASLLCWMVGNVWTALGLQRAFASVGEQPPESRAVHLADGIAAAMRGTVIFGTLATGLGIVSVVVFVVGSFRAPSPNG